MYARVATAVGAAIDVARREEGLLAPRARLVGSLGAALERVAALHRRGLARGLAYSLTRARVCVCDRTTTTEFKPSRLRDNSGARGVVVLL